MRRYVSRLSVLALAFATPVVASAASADGDPWGLTASVPDWIDAVVRVLVACIGS